jgi:hypothetical protein
MPPVLEHPLSQAAKDSYACSDLTCDHAARLGARRRLEVKVSSERFTVPPHAHRPWATMVAARYMSLLARYTDSELAAGIPEICEQHCATVQFGDT